MGYLGFVWDVRWRTRPSGLVGCKRLSAPRRQGQTSWDPGLGMGGEWED